MTVYADNSFYTGTYLSGRSAAVTAAEFPYFARKASALIDRCTFGGIPPDDVPEAVRLCCCELAEKLHASEAAQQDHGGLTSEEVGGWKKTFENAEQRRQNLNRELGEIIRQWLSETGLLYGGVST